MGLVEMVSIFYRYTICFFVSGVKILRGDLHWILKLFDQRTKDVLTYKAPTSKNTKYTEILCNERYSNLVTMKYHTNTIILCILTKYLSSPFLWNVIMWNLLILPKCISPPDTKLYWS